MKIATAIPIRTFLCFMSFLFKYTLYITTDKEKNGSWEKNKREKEKKERFRLPLATKCLYLCPINNKRQ